MKSWTNCQRAEPEGPITKLTRILQNVVKWGWLVMGYDQKYFGVNEVKAFNEIQISLIKNRIKLFI